jgi:hypothetical protein
MTNPTQQPAKQTVKAGDVLVLANEFEYSSVGIVKEVVNDGYFYLVEEIQTTNPNQILRTFEVPYDSILKINGRYVMRRLYSGTIAPDTKMVVGLTTEMQVAEKPQEDILWEAAQALNYSYVCSHQKITTMACDQVWSGIKTLCDIDEYKSIGKLAHNILRASIERPDALIDKLSYIHRRLHEADKLHHKLISMNLNDLRDMLTPEAQKLLFADLDVLNRARELKTPEP